MFTGLLLQPLALALAGAVAAAPTSSARCAQLWESAPKELASLEVYVAQDYPGEFFDSIMCNVELTDPPQREPTSRNRPVSSAVAPLRRKPS